MTEPIDQATKESECRKALQCLYIAVDEQVASDVDNKVSAYVYELKEKLKQERNKAIEALEKHHDSIEKGDEYSKGVANCINILYSLFKDKSHE